jgi:hypothetical protein
MMELLTPSLAHACIMATCTDPCLHAGEHHKDRVEFCVSEGVKLGTTPAFGTWLALGGEFVTLGKYKGNTLVYLPSHDTFYFAAPSVLLSQECPDGTVLLAQFVVDTDSTPRVLVFDVLKLQGVSFRDMPPRERYACLQRLGGCLGPVCTLQWVGECKVLTADLQSGRFKVPHPVKGVMALSLTPGRMAPVAVAVSLGPGL